MKKHFIFLGAAGVIYYSWLLALIFVVIVIYTWFNSYFQKEASIYWLKLPYRQKLQLQNLKIKWQWKVFVVYEAKSKINTYLLLALKRKKK